MTYIVFVFFWLTSLSMIISRSIHVAEKGIFCSSWLSNIHVCVCVCASHIFLSQSPADGHLLVFLSWLLWIVFLFELEFSFFPMDLLDSSADSHSSCKALLSRQPFLYWVPLAISVPSSHPFFELGVVMGASIARLVAHTGFCSFPLTFPYLCK